MMEGWKEYRLGDLVDINTESIGRNYPFTEINYYDIGSVKSGFFENIETILLSNAPSRAKRIVKDKDTILSTVRPRNRSFYYFREAKKNDIASTGFAVLRPNQNKIDDRYLYYLVTDYNFTAFLASNEKGAAYPAVTIDVIERAKIHLPPLPTQRKIAKILSAYDDLIENNLKRIKLLEEMAQKTYEEWFVFRKIDNELIDDSQIDFQNLEELIADYMNGGWGKEIEVGNYTFPAYVIRGTDMPDISRGSFGKLPLRFHTGSNFKSRELKYGDVIIEMSNGNISNVGRSFYYDRDFNKLLEHPAMCASFCKMLRPKSVELSYIVNSHIKYIYNTNRMLVYKSHAANGINNFRFEDMISDEILSIPKGALLNKLVATLKPKYELISNVRNQIKLLKEARDILLQRLMTGMIDVDKMEIDL